MKKQLILIMSLILLVGITAGTLIFVSRMEDNKAAEEARIEQEKVLFTISSNDVEKIELKTPDGEYTAVLDESGKWTLENQVDFEINTYYLNSLTSQLSTLNALEIICPIAEADIAQYGLDNPSVITFYADGEPHTLNIGKLAATKEFYYVTVEGRDSVFSLSADYADYLNLSKNSLKSIYIMRNSDSPVESVSLEAHGETVYSLSMNSDGIWSMSEPVKIDDRINTSGVNALLTEIRQMIIDKFGDENVTEDRYAELGFDKPEYTFTFTQENGEITTLLAQDYDVNDVTFVALLCKETGQAFYMESSYTGFLQDSPAQFILETVYQKNINDIKSLDIEWSERENVELTMDTENEEYTLNGKSLESGGTDAVKALEEFYDKLQAVSYENFIIEEPSDAEPEIKLSYITKENDKVTVEFRRTGDDYAVYVDGEYSYFTVSKKNFTAREGIYDYFDRFIDDAGV